MELSKYIKSQSVELKRSTLHFASYNPRKISEEAKKTLKRGMKKFGLVGGIVVNKQTGFTIVSGHQRLAVMDDLEKYKEGESDYIVRVDVIDVDEKTEKELNILLNNPNSQGSWDFDALAQLIPDIDYKDAGLTEADLNMIGVDYLLQTEEENNITSDLNDLMQEVNDTNEAEKAERKAEREAQAAAEREAKVQHMKDVKAEVKEAAQKKAMDMDAYVMLSFDTFEAKAAFMQQFGYPDGMKMLKGETFAEQLDELING